MTLRLFGAKACDPSPDVDDATIEIETGRAACRTGRGVMSDEPPPDAGDGPGPLPRCGRVVLAAVGPGSTTGEASSTWTDAIALGDDRVGLVVADAGDRTVPRAQLRRIVTAALREEHSPARAL